MIAHSIRVAQKTKIFDKIYVSTNCKSTSIIAKKYGAIVPFVRPEKLSNNKSTDIEVLKHFLKFFKNKNITFSYLCYVYPTSPILKAETIKKSFNLLKNKKAQKVLTISQYEYPIQRALKMNQKGLVSFREPKYKNSSSQKLKNFIKMRANFIGTIYRK